MPQRWIGSMTARSDITTHPWAHNRTQSGVFRSTLAEKTPSEGERWRRAVGAIAADGGESTQNSIEAAESEPTRKESDGVHTLPTHTRSAPLAATAADREESEGRREHRSSAHTGYHRQKLIVNRHSTTARGGDREGTQRGKSRSNRGNRCGTAVEGWTVRRSSRRGGSRRWAGSTRRGRRGPHDDS